MATTFNPPKPNQLPPVPPEAPVPPKPQWKIPGFNVLLMGDSGCGKTTALRSLVADCGLELFCIFTEPSMESLAPHVDGIPWPDIDPKKVHWAYVPPSTNDFATMLDQARSVSKMSWSLISQQVADPNKAKYTSYVKLLETLFNFKDAVTGEEFGPVDSWDQSRVLVLDSLSGLNAHCMQFITGQSIARSQPQWGAAMSTELNLINKLCYDTKCHFVMTAHLDKERDEVSGRLLTTAHALGKANTPEIPKNFSDIILQRRDADKFRWSTMADNTVVAPRNLPLSDKLDVGFKQLFETWQAKALA